MAKKKKKNDDGASKADEIMDSLAEEVGADEGDADPAPDAEKEAAPKAPVSLSKGRKGFTPWPVDPEHESVTDMLMGAGGDPDVIIADDPEPGLRRRGVLNLILVVLVVGAAAGGGYGLALVSSEEALAAKKAAALEAEQQHLEEQLAKQKKYGVLRIESNPPQAIVLQDGEKIVVKGEALAGDAGVGQGDAGVGEMVVMTPTTIQNLDISQTYKFRLEKDGYEPFEFAVSEHLWTKEGEEYKLFKLVDLIPVNCEYWFLYDAKKKREMKFEDQASCLEYHDTAAQKQVTVTECTCKLPPEGATPTADKK